LAPLAIGGMFPLSFLGAINCLLAVWIY